MSNTNENKKYDADKTDAEHVAEINKSSFEYLLAHIEDLEAQFQRERYEVSTNPLRTVVDFD